MISGSSSLHRKKLVGREMPMLKLATEAALLAGQLAEDPGVRHSSRVGGARGAAPERGGQPFAEAGTGGLHAAAQLPFCLGARLGGVAQHEQDFPSHAFTQGGGGLGIHHPERDRRHDVLPRHLAQLVIGGAGRHGREAQTGEEQQAGERGARKDHWEWVR